jgi:hypothetical protein
VDGHTRMSCDIIWSDTNLTANCERALEVIVRSFVVHIFFGLVVVVEPVIMGAKTTPFPPLPCHSRSWIDDRC